MTRRAPRSVVALLGLALALLLSCTKPRTQIILLIDTDMMQGPSATLTHVRVTVKNLGQNVIRQRLTYPLLRTVGGQTFELPATLGIAAADNDGAHSVEVNVDAVNDPGGDGTARTAMFTYYAIAPFESERTKLLSVFLADRCRVLASQCLPDETCGLNGCVPRNVGALPDVDPEFRFDAGRRDVSALDATSDAAIDGAFDATSDGAFDATSDGAFDATSDLSGDSTDDATTDSSSDATLDLVDAAGGDATCGVTQTRCGADCVDTSTDARNCGACGASCSTANATPTCRAGACRLTCARDFGDCDGDVTNGCESSLTTPMHCGACGSACSLPGVSAAACVSGSCAVGACASGRSDCDHVALNGCEVDTQNDGANCGACGRLCGAGFVCNGGACSIACATGRTACGSACVDLRNDPAHCGACSTACPSRPNALTTCSSGACGFVCSAGFADCDGNPANGCETSLSTATACGACGRACTAANAVGACSSGSCGFTCNASFGDCDGVASNGCETDTRFTAAHCGACNAPCVLPHALATCSSSRCTIATCDAGFADCDANPANGCEVNTQSTPSRCGGCGISCSFANAAAACVGGACALGTCNTGFGNCNSFATDGCEVNLNTSNIHCGRCGNACPSGSACAAGVCVSTCPTGTLLCNAACVSIATSVDNCGRCGGVCSSVANSTRVCASGACGFTCDASWGDCDRVASNGCESSLATLANCGACGLVCMLPNASAECSTLSCRVARCNTDWADCDGAALTGCERHVSEDPLNCGACGNVCPSGANGTPRCTGGRCGFDCAPGYADCDRNPSNGCEGRIGGLCGDGCATGALTCLGTVIGCLTSTLPCGTRCSFAGVPGVCDTLGLCSPSGAMCSGGTLDGGSPDAPSLDSAVTDGALADLSTGRQ